MNYHGKNKTVIILILGALTTISPFSIDMYLPAFNQIAADFNSTPALVSFSVTSYFIGLAIGQLLYGPLLDKFGRKKPLYYGLSFYILASIGCMQSTTVDALVIFRFIQALGGCVAIVAAMSMVKDFFSNEESARIFSLLVLILGTSPLLAPTLGGFVATWLGWKWIFIVLSIIVFLILIITVFYLPSKYKPDPSVSLKPRPILETFIKVLGNREFLTYTLAGAFSFSTMFIYVAGSPVIFLEIFKISPTLYGGIFAALSVGFIGSNQLNILLLRKYKSAQIFNAAITGQLLCSLCFLVAAWNGWIDLYGTIGFFFLILCCLGLTYPNASSLALAPFTRNIGSASALLGSLQIGIAGLASAGVGLLNAKATFPIVLLLTTTTTIAFFILMIGKRLKKNSEFSEGYAAVKEP